MNTSSDTKIPISLLMVAATFFAFSTIAEQPAFASDMVFSTDTEITDNQTIENGETWIIESGVELKITHGAKITMNPGSTIENKGTFNIMLNGIVVNAGGIIINDGISENEGTVENGKDGIFKNHAESLFYNLEGTFNNDGLFENKGKFDNRIGSTINNNPEGSIINDYEFENEGVFNNDGTVTIKTDGYFRNLEGTFHNDGLFENEGSFTNRAEGTFNNNVKGTIANDGKFDNEGIINNIDGTINSKGALGNHYDGVFENEGMLNILEGTILNQIAGTLINLEGTIIISDAIFENRGIINNFEGIISNSPQSTIDNIGGTINNEDVLSNQGVINNNSEGIIDNKVGGVFDTSDGTFNNDGVFNDDVISDESEPEIMMQEANVVKEKTSELVLPSSSMTDSDGDGISDDVDQCPNSPTDGNYDSVGCIIYEEEISVYVTPLKQFKSGITLEKIQCRESLILMKKLDGSPACVSLSTSDKLMDRGWTYLSSN